MQRRRERERRPHHPVSLIRSLRREAASAALASAIVLLACGREPLRPQKKVLCRLPASYGPIAISDDASSYAYVEREGPKQWVVHDGVPGPRYAGGAGGLTFAPVSRKLFYWAGETVDRGFLFADGAKLGDDIVRESTIAFSDDGQHWATAAEAWDRESEKNIRPGPVVVFADGHELGRHPDASLPAVSPDGRHVAYLVATEGGDGTRLIVDGVEQAAYPTPAPVCAARAKPRKRRLNPYYWPQFQVRYLSDGRLLVMTQAGDGWEIYRDGTRIASYAVSVEQSLKRPAPECSTAPTIAAWSLTTAAKAPVAAWWERVPGEAERWRMVVDGKPVDDVTCSKAWEIQPAEFTPDGRRVAYACGVSEPEQRVFLVVDGRRYGPYFDMWAYAWSDDGAHVAYGATDAPPGTDWRYYVDGEPRSEALSAVWRPRLEDGRLLVEARRTDDEPGSLRIDARRVASFDDILWGPSMLRPRTVTWVIRRGRRVVRLDVPTATASTGWFFR
jgi:hypothetical protein